MKITNWRSWGRWGRHHGTGFITRLTYVGLVGISIIVLGALIACPTEDDGDDGGPTASFAAATSAITEGASDTIGVTLSADAGADGVAVQFGVVSDGTTAEDDDWQITTGSGVSAVAGSANTWTVTIPSGMRSATITVVTSNDTDAEDETLIFELQEGSSYSVGNTSRHTLTINDITPVFTFDPGETAYRFSIGEGGYSASSPGEVGTVSATNATRYAITAGNTGTRFAIDGTGAITAIDELDFEDTAIPNSYTLTVTAHNGADADAPSATATVTISVNDIEAGLVSSIAAYEVTVDEDGAFVADATDQRQSLAGNASGTTLNLGAIATVDNFIPTTFTITPSSPFALTKAAGLDAEAMLTATAAGLDFEATGNYTLMVAATGATNSNRITLNVTVTDVDYVNADDLTVQEDATTLALMLSAVDGTTTYTVAGISSVDTPNTPFSVAAGPPLPTALTVDPDQLAVEDAAKPDSYSDVVITIEIDGGGLNNDVEIITVGTITVTGTPGFLDTLPTLFLREDGMFVAVGDTTLADPSNTIDLAEMSEYTFTKGGFVPSGVTLDSVAPASGMPSFSIADTTLTVTNPENLDFEDGDKDSFTLTITDRAVSSTLTVEIADFQDGDSDEPYKIDSVTELQSIDTAFVNDYTTANTITLTRAQSLAAHYLLTADLDFDTDTSGTVDSRDTIHNFDPIGDCGGDGCGDNINDNLFTGGFDGGGNTIANLTINRSLEGVGLFAIASGVSIRNLFLQDVNITGHRGMGGLTGRIHGSSVRFVAVTGTMSSTGNDVGAVAGNFSATTYFAVLANVAISGTAGQIRALLASTREGGDAVRKINSHAAGTVADSRAAANIIGNNSGSTGDTTLHNVYGRGEIKSGSGNAGVIGGINPSSDIIATNVYWDTESSTQSMPIGSQLGGGTIPDPFPGITGLNTAGMQGLTASASGWQTEFSPGIDLDDDDTVDDPDDVHLSVRCDANGDGTVDADEWLWDFGTTSQYPALNCMPISLDEQRSANRQ